jgi:hypothetical protein
MNIKIDMIKYTYKNKFTSLTFQICQVYKNKKASNKITKIFLIYKI